MSGVQSLNTLYNALSLSFCLFHTRSLPFSHNFSLFNRQQKECSNFEARHVTLAKKKRQRLPGYVKGRRGADKTLQTDVAAVGAAHERLRPPGGASAASVAAAVTAASEAAIDNDDDNKVNGWH